MSAAGMEGLIRRARQAKGLSGSELAARLGLSWQSVCDAELRGDKATVALMRRYGEAMDYELVIAYRDKATGELIE